MTYLNLPWRDQGTDRTGLDCLNACFIHWNETNFGGFAELPKETVVRA